MAELPFVITVEDDGSVVIKRFGDGVQSTGRRVQRTARRMARAFRSVGQRINRLPGLVFSVKSALVGLGGALVLRSILKAGDAVETARARLIGLRGGIEGANEAFSFFQKVAGEVAFSLEDVVQAGVAVEAFGAKSEEVLESVTDLAAFMGVGLPEAASAFGRAFAGGAGAADILRERGVLTLVSLKTGIDDLTKISLPEFREALLSAMSDPTAAIVGSAQRLALTWRGTISFLEDAWFKLRQSLFEAGIGDFLKNLVRNFTDLVNGFTVLVKENAPTIKEFFDDLIERIPQASEVVNFFSNILGVFIRVWRQIAQAMRDTITVSAGVANAFDNTADIILDARIEVQKIAQGLKDLEEAGGNAAGRARELGRAMREASDPASKFLKVLREVARQAGLEDIEDEISSLRKVSREVALAILLDARALGLEGAELGEFIRLQLPLLEEMEKASSKASQSVIRDATEGFSVLSTLSQGQATSLFELMDRLSERQQERLFEELEMGRFAGDEAVTEAERTVRRILATREVLRTGSVRILGAIAQFAQTQGEKAFKVAQAFQIGQAITSGILAVQEALASFPGPPATIPLAAAIAVETAANVQRIRSARPGGGGGISAPSGGGGGAAAAITPTAEAAPGDVSRQINISVSGFVGEESVLASELARILRDADEDEVRTTVSRV